MRNNCKEAFRKRTCSLLGSAYTSLPLTRAQIYLGLNAEEAIRGLIRVLRFGSKYSSSLVNAAAPTLGWSYDHSAKILTVNSSGTALVGAPSICEFICPNRCYQGTNDVQRVSHRCRCSNLWRIVWQSKSYRGVLVKSDLKSIQVGIEKDLAVLVMWWR
jgi:hypothetical protein